jgi:hypothetical protein
MLGGFAAEQQGNTQFSFHLGAFSELDNEK